MTVWNYHDSKASRCEATSASIVSFYVQKLRALSYLSTLCFASLLGACAENTVITKPTEIEQAAETKDLTKTSALAFTTKGKETKFLETPWGMKEIYDPSKDEVVIDAIDSLYQKGGTSFGDIARLDGFGRSGFNLLGENVAAGIYGGPNQPTPTKPTRTELQIETVKIARRAHYYDVLRSGCKRVTEVPCQYHGSLYFKRQCPNHDYGSAELNICESENVTTDFSDISGPIIFAPPGHTNLKGPNPQYHVTAHQCDIDGIKNKIQGPLLIGNQSGYSLAETIRLLTNNVCAEWHKNENSGKTDQ